jgi:hypothetical protein
VTDRDLLWKLYAEYMTHANLCTETLTMLVIRLKEPVSMADEWKMECIRMLEDIKHLQSQLDRLK